MIYEDMEVQVEENTEKIKVLQAQIATISKILDINANVIQNIRKQLNQNKENNNE